MGPTSETISAHEPNFPPHPSPLTNFPLTPNPSPPNPFPHNHLRHSHPTGFRAPIGLYFGVISAP